MKQSIEQRISALEKWRDETSKDAEIKRLRAENLELARKLMAEEQRRIVSEMSSSSRRT